MQYVIRLGCVTAGKLGMILLLYYYCSWGYIDEEHGTVHCSPAWRTLLLHRTILESSRCRTDDRAVSIRSSHFFDRDERMKNAQLAVRCANDVNSQSWSMQSVISNCLKSVRFQYSSDGSKWAEFRPHERVDAWTVLWEKHELSNSESEMTITTLYDDELTVPVVLRIKNAVFPNICSGFLIWDERWDHYVNHYWTFRRDAWELKSIRDRPKKKRKLGTASLNHRESSVLAGVSPRFRILPDCWIAVLNMRDNCLLIYIPSWAIVSILNCLMIVMADVARTAQL